MEMSNRNRSAQVESIYHEPSPTECNYVDYSNDESDYEAHYDQPDTPNEFWRYGQGLHSSSPDYENVPSSSQMPTSQPIYAAVNKRPKQPLVQVDQIYAQINKTPKKKSIRIEPLYAEVNKTPKNNNASIATDPIYENVQTTLRRF